jgi:hypoxanthine-guanine phosphoribosyltransferase
MVCPSYQARAHILSFARFLMVTSPQAISAGMLRVPPTNLNKQSQDATVLLIRDVLQRGLQLSEVGRALRCRTNTKPLSD